jgi:hypothetical protein
MFIFAIIILLYNLAWPWAYETATGRSWRFSQVAPAVSRPAPMPRVVQPARRPTLPQAPPPQVTVNIPDKVNVRIEPPPTPAVQPEQPVQDLTPEELDRRHSEYLRRNQ